MANRLLRKALNPKHLYIAFSRQRSKGSSKRHREDPQLKLIAKICPGEFLNYGHFENVDLSGEDICIADIARAQELNAEQFVGLIREHEKCVLDVGCGVGGITRMMLGRDITPVALSPNQYQIEQMASKFPGVELVRSRFEDIDTQDFTHRFDVILMSESLQYIDLDRAMNVAEKVLKARGRWLIVDFFRKDELGERSGHIWDVFVEKLHQNGWKIAEQWDHTQNVLPLLRYIHMLGTDLLKPSVEFIFDKLHEKHPGFHYLIEDGLNEFFRRADKQLDVINPSNFEAHKKYVMMAIEKA